MKNILHIMLYNSIHITLPLIRDFCQIFDIPGVSHGFILYGSRDEEKDAKYDKLEKDFSICLNYIESEMALSIYLKGKDNYSILIHGDSFPCIKRSVRANNRVSWICWGYIPQKGSIFFLSDISFILRKLIYKRLKTSFVCCLVIKKNYYDFISYQM